MPRIEYNPGLCSGCQICEQICALTNEKVLNIEKSRIKIITEFGLNYIKHTAYICRQCEDPPCVKACPTQALEKKDGRIVLHKDKCIGCKNCVNACPYNAAFWHPDLNYPLICTACGACVAFCPMGALKLVQ